MRLVCLLTLALTLGAARSARGADSLWVDLERREVRVAAVVHPERFQGEQARAAGMDGYHLLVWEKGRAAGHALITTPVDDRALHRALVEIGAAPGNRLGMDSWDARYDPENPAPDRRLEGSPVWIGLSWGDYREPRSLALLLADPGGRGLEFRFGGHAANIPSWQSGCGVCLYSCPGSKVGNATYTVRDYVDGVTRFRIRKERFPAEGTSVTVVFRLQPTAPGAPAEEP